MARRMIDAQVMIDAMIDAPPPMWVAVETFPVSCLAGQSVTTTTVLLVGEVYRLRAAGECIVNDQNLSRGDPEYYGYNVGPTYDVYSDIDNGIAVDDATPGLLKQPRWGTYSSAHTHEVPWTGAGTTITVRYHDTNYANNSGAMTFTLLRYQ